MKNILFSLILLLSYNSLLAASYGDSTTIKYSITVWDYDYSMASTTFYHITNDSLVIKSISGLENQHDTIMAQRLLKKEETKLFLNFFSSFNLTRLKTKYINPLIDDGDRKRITIEINNKTKTIEIANFYQRDIGSLIDVLNQVVPINLKVLYKKTTTK